MARYLRREGSGYFLVSEEDDKDVLGPMNHDQADVYAFALFSKIRAETMRDISALSVPKPDAEGIQRGDDKLPEEYQKAMRLLLGINPIPPEQT
jgi:hypothetical protein